MKTIEQGYWEEKYKPIKENGSLKDFHPKVVNKEEESCL